MKNFMSRIKSIAIGVFVVCVAATFVIAQPAHVAVSQGNGCNTSVGSTSSPAGNGTGLTGACFSGQSYKHSSQTQAYGTYTIRVYLSSSDGSGCNARSVDSGYVVGTSVIQATAFASVLSCSHPPPYLGTGVHWINGTQFISTSVTIQAFWTG